MTGSLVAIAAGEAALTIAPAMGGAWTSFTWRGQPVLRNTPEAALLHENVRASSCYPLVPYSNRIAAATLRFAGVTRVLARNFGDHPNSIHGVGWQRPWHVVRHDGAFVQLAFTHDAADPDAQAAWPWPFAASQALRIVPLDDGGAALHATLTLESRAGEPFPFGLGWHPFFPTTQATLLDFAARGVWRNGPTELPIEHVAIPPAWDFMLPRPIDVALDQVFTGWSGRAGLLQPDTRLRATIEADHACGCLVVYSPAWRDDVALEPVTHETDAFNRADAGATGTGLRILRPGEAFSCTMRLTVAPLA